MRIEKLSPEFLFLNEWLDLEAATGEPGARWEPYQIMMLNDPNDQIVVNKTRQAGFSWTIAARQVARSQIYPGRNGVFISINKDESKEKIRYAKRIIEAIHPLKRPRLTINNKTEIEINNKSRLISHAAKPARGKEKTDLNLDEWGHYEEKKKIYEGSSAAMIHGGSLIGGSTPMGASGKFWEVFEQEMQVYPGFTRYMLPWWVINRFCTDIVLANKIAHLMDTEERVERFGTDAIKKQYANLPLDAFQQEFECLFVDEVTSWIPWDEIKRNHTLFNESNLIHYMAKAYPRADGSVSIDQCINYIDALAQRVNAGLVESSMTAGFDVGRHNNLSELFILGEGLLELQPFRLSASLDRVEFDDQETVLKYAMDNLPIRLLLMDKNGLGEQLSENMHKHYGDRAQGFSFTNPNKALLATGIKVKMQKRLTPIPNDKNLSYQIHSIKKKVTPSKNVVYDTEGNQTHHADKFWAWCLAAYGGGQESVKEVGDIINLGG